METSRRVERLARGVLAAGGRVVVADDSGSTRSGPEWSWVDALGLDFTVGPGCVWGAASCTAVRLRSNVEGLQVVQQGNCVHRRTRAHIAPIGSPIAPELARLLGVLVLGDFAREGLGLQPAEPKGLRVPAV